MSTESSGEKNTRLIIKSDRVIKLESLLEAFNFTHCIQLVIANFLSSI